MRTNAQIRSFTDKDLDPIVKLSLLAWKPVFRSFKRVLGPTIYPLIYPDWRKRQTEVVTTICRDREGAHTLVAEVDERVIGFVTYELDEEDETGKVLLLAVRPDHQNRGIGTELNVRALQEMKAAGMKLAEVGTGGDEGHAPARQCYEKAGYTGLPLVRYYKAL
jgi:GNAT superfamily N-acetyltransferase